MQECFRCANVLHAPMNVESGMRAPKSIFTWHGNLSKRIRCSSPGAGLLHDSSEIHHTIPAGQYSCSQQSNPLKRPHRVAWLRGNAIHSPLQDSHVRYNSAMPLPTDEVHIWWLEADEVHSPKLLQQYLAILPKAEQQYVGEGATEKVRKERLLSRTLVRSVLARYSENGTPPKDLQIQSSPSGKPWLVSEEGQGSSGGQLHFNVTHTDRLLGVAVSRGGLVGLDVEDSSRLTRVSPVALARRRFSPREFAVLTGFENPAEQQRLFIRLWCLKEAYIKATGRGIMAPPGLSGFTFELLLNIKVRPSRRRAPQEEQHGSEKENIPPQLEDADQKLDNPWKYSMDEQQHWKYSMDEQWPSHSALDLQGGRGAAGQGSHPGVVWDPDSRAAFSLQFQPAETDDSSWEAWLMELCGGHTAALVIEANKKGESLESKPDVRLKCFKTIPMMSEDAMSSKYCRVIGYGHSACPL